MAETRRPRQSVYELEPVLARPDLPGTVVAVESADEVIDHVAADLVVHAENCVRQFGDFHLALSADPVLERLYARLMYDADYRRLPWRRTHLWFVEEACVPLDDERSAHRFVAELIGDHADIPPEQYHPIPAAHESGAADYQRRLREVLAWREKGQDRLDYVLLTLGGDGRIPVAAAEGGAADDVPLVALHPGPAGASERVALTIPFINAARFVAVLASGEMVADAVRRAVGEPEAPARRLAPINGELKWYLDAPACGADDRDTD